MACYSDHTRCERNGARYFALNDGRNLACGEAFTTADPFGEVTYARCCCGVGKVVQVLSEPP